MKVDSITDVGLLRGHNEDDVAVGLYEDCAYAIVCDGMGGAQAGEVASHNGVEVIENTITERYGENLSIDGLEAVLRTAIQNANSAIYHLSESFSHLSGMGTTVVAALATRDLLTVCHVGDSRAYLIRDDVIIPLTKDHSVVQQLVDAGTLTEEEAKNHPQRNIITRCLGVHARVEVEWSQWRLEEGDKILLCSDGLTGYLLDEELLTFAKTLATEALLPALVEEAKKRGGGDNITVALIEK